MSARTLPRPFRFSNAFRQGRPIHAPNDCQTALFGKTSWYDWGPNSAKQVGLAEIPVPACLFFNSKQKGYKYLSLRRDARPRRARITRDLKKSLSPRLLFGIAQIPVIPTKNRQTNLFGGVWNPVVARVFVLGACLESLQPFNRQGDGTALADAREPLRRLLARLWQPQQHACPVVAPGCVGQDLAERLSAVADQ